MDASVENVQEVPQTESQEVIDPLKLYVACPNFRGLNASKLKAWLTKEVSEKVVDVNKIATRANSFIEFDTEADVAEFMAKAVGLSCRGKTVEVRRCFVRANAPAVSNVNHSCSASHQDEKRKEKRSTIPELINGRLPTLAELLDRKTQKGVTMESIADKVTPLLRFSYADQVDMKHNYVKSLLRGATKKFHSLFNEETAAQHSQKSSLPAWRAPIWSAPYVAKGFHGVEMTKPIESSEDAREEYRNKVEMTINFEEGVDGGDDKISVGFVNTLKNNSPVITQIILDPVEGREEEVPADEKEGERVVHVTKQMTLIAMLLKKKLQSLHSSRKNITSEDSTPIGLVYNRITKRGCWRQVLVRQNEENELMIAVQTCPPSMWAAEASPLTSDEEEAHRSWANETIRDLFLNNNDEIERMKSLYNIPSFKIQSLFIQEHSNASDCFDETGALRQIFGDKGTLTMTLMGVKFEVAPLAFFQTNPISCHSLFSMALDKLVSSLNTAPSSTESSPASDKKLLLLDVCCGAGTIGLCASKRLGSSIHRVIGVDIVDSAIKDAKANAERNGLGSVSEWICDKAEVALPAILRDAQMMLDSKQVDEVVAIVDPPRAGLHPDVLRALRECPFLSKVVYISCNPVSLSQNLVDLCTPLPPNDSSKLETFSQIQQSGGPWVPVEATIVDMFPHTHHVETVLLFQREKFTSFERDYPEEKRAALREELKEAQLEKEERQAEEREIAAQVKKEKQEKALKDRDEARRKRIEAADLAAKLSANNPTSADLAVTIEPVKRDQPEEGDAEEDVASKVAAQ